jgi:predicted lipoprotein with Yx(FWY)xxD motif
VTVHLLAGRLARIALPLFAVSVAACSSPTAEAPAEALPTEAAAEAAQLAATAPLGDAGDLPTVQVASHTEYGDFLVDGDGMSLYIFMEDADGTSTCNGLCAENWPPLIADGDPVAGSGVDQALLSTSARDDGSLQVTYNGQPLYRFVEDALPGDTGGQDKGDTWYLVSPAGEKIEDE